MPMMFLPAYPLNRPAWFDADKVSVVVDLVEGRPSKLAGGEPSLAIVGTQIVCDGFPINLAGPAGKVAEQIAAQRTRHLTLVEPA